MTARRPEPAVAGFTMVEMSIVFALLATVSIMVSKLLDTMSRMQAYGEGQARLRSFADRVLSEIAADATFAVRLVTNDGTSKQTYLDALDLKSLAMLPRSRLPVATEHGCFRVDPPGTPTTGNVLLMVRSLTPIPVQVGPANEVVRIDRLRFVLYCLVERADGELDLVRWGSVPVASVRDLTALADEERRAEAGRRLRQAGIEFAWRAEEAVDAAFYSIGTDGKLAPYKDIAKKKRKIAEDRALCRRDLMRNVHAAVARNGSLHAARVPAYTRAGVGFPHGFEVKVDGPCGTRLGLVRLVIASEWQTQRVYHAEIVRVLSVHEY